MLLRQYDIKKSDAYLCGKQACGIGGITWCDN